MSLPKLLLYSAGVVFGTIFLLAYFKGGNKPAPASEKIALKIPVEIELEVEAPKPAPPPLAAAVKPKIATEAPPVSLSEVDRSLPEADRIEELFKKPSSLKFIETITYKSRVPWQKGRPAWLSDYASHYETSRHFIARSLNGKPDYFKQDVAERDKFNVFKKDVKLSFHLVIDTSLCKMWLYALDQTHNERVLLKTYTVSLGRPDSGKASGLLTPLGRYSLGSRIAIYKPKVMGYYNGKKIEMIRVFGSRWIPFDKEIAQATAPAKGFGLHGVPWAEKKGGELVQDKSSLGKYESDGCIRLGSEDMEEIFAIVITKPTEIEIVRHFQEASFQPKKS